jgi:DNA-binding transcriptional ArsR family regulator
VTKATASHHFKVLREAGLVMTRLDGPRRFLRLRREELDARFPGLLGAVLAAELAGATA